MDKLGDNAGTSFKVIGALFRLSLRTSPIGRMIEGTYNQSESVAGEAEEPSTPEATRPRGLPPEGVSPPTDKPLTPGTASRPSEAEQGGQSLFDPEGREWRYYPEDRWHNPHWDTNPHDRPNAGWENVPIGDLPVHK